MHEAILSCYVWWWYACMYVCVHMCMHTCVPVYGAYGDQRPVLGFVPHAIYHVA